MCVSFLCASFYTHRFLELHLEIENFTVKKWANHSLFPLCESRVHAKMTSLPVWPVNSKRQYLLTFTSKQILSFGCADQSPFIQWCIAQLAQNIFITFVQRRPNVFDVGPTLCKCYKNVLCLLGYLVICVAWFRWVARLHREHKQGGAVQPHDEPVGEQGVHEREALQARGGRGRRPYLCVRGRGGLG